LLAAGADVDHADCDGWTALRAAAWGGHAQVNYYCSLELFNNLIKLAGSLGNAPQNRL
jgi:hypothetical protein